MGDRSCFYAHLRVKLDVVATGENERGEYGGEDDRKSGLGGVLVALGLGIGIFGLSPGARHFYKHGYLPPVRR